MLHMQLITRTVTVSFYGDSSLLILSPWRLENIRGKSETPNVVLLRLCWRSWPSAILEDVGKLSMYMSCLWGSIFVRRNPNESMSSIRMQGAIPFRNHWGRSRPSFSSLQGGSNGYTVHSQFIVIVHHLGIYPTYGAVLDQVYSGKGTLVLPPKRTTYTTAKRYYTSIIFSYLFEGIHYYSSPIPLDSPDRIITMPWGTFQ